MVVPGKSTDSYMQSVGQGLTPVTAIPLDTWKGIIIELIIYNIIVNSDYIFQQSLSSGNILRMWMKAVRKGILCGEPLHRL